MLKKCSMCHVMCDRSNYNKCRTTVDKLGSYCLECRRKIAKKSRAKNRKAINARAKAWYRANPRKALTRYLKMAYNMGIEQYDKMFKDQLGACAICREQNLEGKRLHVDHNHENGKIRGLLCVNCNLLLGNAKDRISTLILASEYLEKTGQKVSI